MSIDWQGALFWVFAATAVVPALILLVTRDVVRMAFWLLFSFAGFAGLYLLLGADFLAVTQILVYIGGILVLLLFGVMLTRKHPDVAEHPKGPGPIVPGLAAAALMAGLLIWAVTQTPWSTQAADPEPYTAAGIGDLLMTDYLLPFEAASVVLLVALVGAAYIVRRGREEE